MALSMKTLKTSLVASTKAPRKAVVVRATQENVDRRAMFGLIAAAMSAPFVSPREAEALKIPSHEFTGGLKAGGGALPKSSTQASMEGYTLEGTRKYGISSKRKAKILARAKAEAAKDAKA